MVMTRAIKLRLQWHVPRIVAYVTDTHIERERRGKRERERESDVCKAWTGDAYNEREP